MTAGKTCIGKYAPGKHVSRNMRRENMYQEICAGKMK